MTAARLHHGTAVVVGTMGILVTGASGAGKSRLALDIITEATGRGLFGALVADDQVRLSVVNGRILGEGPPSIAGMIEIRGSRIARVANIAAAIMHVAVAPADTTAKGRIPPFDERFEIDEGHGLPLLRLAYPGAPSRASALAAIYGFAGGKGPFFSIS